MVLLFLLTAGLLCCLVLLSFFLLALSLVLFAVGQSCSCRQAGARFGTWCREPPADRFPEKHYSRSAQRLHNSCSSEEAVSHLFRRTCIP